MSTKHLPILGVGPLYVASLAIITAVLSALNLTGVLSGGGTPFVVVILARVLGLALIVGGVWLWVAAVVQSRIVSKIKAGKLVTDGAYAWVRHPIYAAVALVCDGVLVAQANPWLLLAIPVFYLLGAALLSRTEERWLERTFAGQYRRYAARTNRLVPWPPKR